MLGELILISNSISSMHFCYLKKNIQIFHPSLPNSNVIHLITVFVLDGGIEFRPQVCPHYCPVCPASNGF